jgi:hypothetical protein
MCIYDIRDKELTVAKNEMWDALIGLYRAKIANSGGLAYKQSLGVTDVSEMRTPGHLA